MPRASSCAPAWRAERNCGSPRSRLALGVRPRRVNKDFSAATLASCPANKLAVARPIGPARLGVDVQSPGGPQDFQEPWCHDVGIVVAGELLLSRTASALQFVRVLH